MIGTFIKTSPYTYIAGFVILLASHGFVYFKGKEYGFERYYDYRAAVDAEMEVVRLENERKLAAMADAAKHAADGWDAARSALARRPVVRVQANSCPGDVPAVSASTGEPDGTSEARTIGAAECETFLHNGIEDAAQLMHLQQWVRDTHEASK